MEANEIDSLKKKFIDSLFKRTYTESSKNISNEQAWLEYYKRKRDASNKKADKLVHHGIKGQKWGERNGPPYPLKSSQKSSEEKKEENNRVNSNTKVVISEKKFINYALNYDKSPDKAKAFEMALGYTKKNYHDLITNISNHLDKKNLINRGTSKYGTRYEQIMKLKGSNGKTANILTAWICDNEGLRLTSVYVTKKRVKE